MVRGIIGITYCLLIIWIYNWLSFFEETSKSLRSPWVWKSYVKVCEFCLYWKILEFFQNLPTNILINWFAYPLFYNLLKNVSKRVKKSVVLKWLLVCGFGFYSSWIFSQLVSLSFVLWSSDLIWFWFKTIRN